MEYVEKPMRTPSSFNEKKDDPAFLVAKGKFSSRLENELQELLRSGARTDDRRIPDLKNQIDDERHELEKKHVKDLSNAIVMALTNHGRATIRCIGRSAVYNACKAMAIARGKCYSKGIDLRFGPSFDEGNLGKLRNSAHVTNVTALVFTLEGFKVAEQEN